MTKYAMRLALCLFIVLVPVYAFSAGGRIVGKVTDSNTGEALPGTNITIKGTTIGAAVNLRGNFEIVNVPPGRYTLVATFIGYKIESKEVTVTLNQTTTADFALVQEVISGATITILADRAKIRETPVAFTNLEKMDMEARLGSQDIPLVLNTTPSVYATMQGGGAGDARVSVRGFNQRNVAIMINGVPINDMENGWVYWSNWDGVADATSSIQVQRGLSAVNLATPSIGGTMNILTDPTVATAGARLKQEIGSEGFLKTTFSASTGMLQGKYAVNATVVRKTGDGVIDKTWTDAWAYYLGASWSVNPNNRLELYALGAPQKHGQNSFKQNIGVLSASFAKDLSDYDPAALVKYPERGRTFNQNWNTMKTSYRVDQFWDGAVRERYEPQGYMNERTNYYHKPIVNLNWYSKLNEKMGLFSTAYYSGGVGGGTGTFGSMRYAYPENNTQKAPRVVDWDATIANNRASTTGSRGILRNSVNTQWTVGAISKLNYQFSKSLQATVGIDGRIAEIKHYREVRDLLGGTYFKATHSAFWTPQEQLRKLGDKIDYNFTNDVKWLGGFGQAEYTEGRITAYGMAGYSIINYDYVNHFAKGPDGGLLTQKSGDIGGYQVKGGASYRFTTNVDAFANIGYVSKVPIFDNVINDRSGVKLKDPQNEKFFSVEAGVNVVALDGKLNVKGNVYNTNWKDRALSREIQDADGNDVYIALTGMNTLHRGVEVEAAFQPIRLVRLDAAVSLGDWKYLEDVSGTYKDYSKPDDIPYDFYVKDLKVGDAPQTQIALMGSVYPIRNLSAQVVLRHYMRHYADWDPFSRTNPADRTQSWRAPNYSVVDFHASYRLPLNVRGVGISLFAHLFNALDEIYIQDALDNSSFNAWDKDHDADDAEVFLGLPRTFNVGLSLSY